jgi:hypothetical protein
MEMLKNRDGLIWASATVFRLDQAGFLFPTVNPDIDPTQPTLTYNRIGAICHA